MSRIPSSGEFVSGQVVSSWLIRTWAQSRAVVERSERVGWGGSGLGSWRRRCPRSKV